MHSVFFVVRHLRRKDQYAVYILYFKFSTDPGILKIPHSHRFVAVVLQILISTAITAIDPAYKYRGCPFTPKAAGSRHFFFSNPLIKKRTDHKS